MAVRSASDVIYVLISRLPLIALLVAVVWLFAGGLAGLERISFGTEYFVGNSETDNVLPRVGGPTDEEILSAALESGDVAVMTEALGEVEARHADASGAATPVLAG